jgi:hypothetical protein
MKPIGPSGDLELSVSVKNFSNSGLLVLREFLRIDQYEPTCRYTSGQVSTAQPPGCRRSTWYGPPQTSLPEGCPVT